MVILDFKDEIFLAPVNTARQKYFKFEWFRKFKFAGKHNDYEDAM